MALDKDALKAAILSNLESNGFNIKSKHSMMPGLADSVATAVVKHINDSGEVAVPSGAGGVYKIK